MMLHNALGVTTRQSIIRREYPPAPPVTCNDFFEMTGKCSLPRMHVNLANAPLPRPNLQAIAEVPGFFTLDRDAPVNQRADQIAEYLGFTDFIGCEGMS